MMVLELIGQWNAHCHTLSHAQEADSTVSGWGMQPVTENVRISVEVWIRKYVRTIIHDH